MTASPSTASTGAEASAVGESPARLVSATDGVGGIVTSLGPSATGAGGSVVTDPWETGAASLATGSAPAGAGSAGTEPSVTGTASVTTGSSAATGAGGSAVNGSSVAGAGSVAIDSGVTGAGSVATDSPATGLAGASEAPLSATGGASGAPLSATGAGAGSPPCRSLASTLASGGAVDGSGSARTGTADPAASPSGGAVACREGSKVSGST